MHETKRSENEARERVKTSALIMLVHFKVDLLWWRASEWYKPTTILCAKQQFTAFLFYKAKIWNLH